jgi:hypothetical protein
MQHFVILSKNGLSNMAPVIASPPKPPLYSGFGGRSNLLLVLKREIASRPSGARNDITH